MSYIIILLPKYWYNGTMLNPALAAECSQTQTQESTIVYADPKLIYNAVNSEKSEIEEAYQMLKMFPLFTAFQFLPDMRYSIEYKSIDYLIILYAYICMCVYFIAISFSILNQERHRAYHMLHA